MTKYEQKKQELQKKELELEKLKEKYAKGQIGGTGVLQMVEDLNTEIHQLLIELHSYAAKPSTEKGES